MLTPTSLRICGRFNIKEHWAATIEVHASDLLLRLAPSPTPSSILVSLAGMPSAPTVVEPRCIKSLFTPRGWHGAISGDGNAAILAAIDGLPNIGGPTLQLTFVKDIDEQQSLRIEAPAECFAFRACQVKTPNRSTHGSTCKGEEAHSYLSRVRDRLRSERLQRNYSLQRMSSLRGTTKTTLGELERGKRKLTLLHLFNVNVALGVPLPELVTP